MSSFRDLLNQPLPSKFQEESGNDSVTTESADVTTENMEGLQTDVDTEDAISDAVGGDDDAADAVGTDDIEDISDDSDFNPDNLSDEELAALDSELSGQAAADANNIDDIPEETLTPEEELRADDMMQVAATSMLVNDELNAEEKANFVNSGEAKVAVEEGFLTDTDVNIIAEEAGLVTEASYNKKMIIRLDAAAKKKQLFALGVRVSAAAHNDPDYKKYKKVMAIKRALLIRMTQKYRGEATKRMKIYFNRLRKSKSAALAGIAKKNDK